MVLVTFGRFISLLNVKAPILTNEVKKPKPVIVTILLTGLLVGTLDGLATLAWNYKANPAIIFEYIAFGVFGKSAFAGGAKMVLWGILFHYIIAVTFTAVFILTYTWFYKIFKNRYLIAFEFGLISWFVMNIIVIPLSKIGIKPFRVVPTVTGMIVLIIAIGLPIALIADRRRKRSLINNLSLRETKQSRRRA